MNLNNISYSLGASITYELLLHKPNKCKKVYYSSKAILNTQFEKIKLLCRQNKIELIKDDIFISKNSLKQNCYVIGEFEKYNSYLSDGICIVINQIDDPNTLGTIIRNCISFSIYNIALIDSNVDVFNKACVRSSMGAIFQANIMHFDSMLEYVSSTQNKLYYLGKQGISLDDVKFDKNVSIVINGDSSDFYIESNYDLSIDSTISILAYKLFKS